MNISEHEVKKYKKLLDTAQRAHGPVVLVNACTHGHETVGASVIEILKTLPLISGTLLFNIANEQAKERGVDYIETDLNRSFPGNAAGTYEEQIASFLHPIVKACDVVIDIHSTNTIKDPRDRMLILTKYDDATRAVAQHIVVSRTIVMEATQNNALISDAPVGLGFEFGGNDRETVVFTTQQVCEVLISLGCIARDVADSVGVSPVCTEQQVYRAYDTFPKTPTMRLSDTVHNFTLVHAGDVVAYEGDVPIRAKKDFIPILFGEGRYETMFGFVGEVVE